MFTGHLCQASSAHGPTRLQSEFAYHFVACFSTFSSINQHFLQCVLLSKNCTMTNRFYDLRDLGTLVQNFSGGSSRLKFLFLFALYLSDVETLDNPRAHPGLSSLFTLVPQVNSCSLKVLNHWGLLCVILQDMYYTKHITLSSLMEPPLKSLLLLLWRNRSSERQINLPTSRS